ncbi:MAG: hypothetical protein COX36_01030 [Candidatus Nealsonbacteria bacterium CG23_combo_of_CG06-09_8_20_14_all_38_19]|uniref:Uncharacterized protein n=1 Tax=Candidatus Nealsonbacteria bacterium CG23_combo_of_CG06-09_8_20_14_all_38_19 TaxID=1974721 RepID=A0A2G9YXG2_9BACT|nr:MAG: hypothetical protein COX36_01030 [Candidatus Nealsonbacteria bacterium CG23_combo_of_CG06-09_8_20_14_all_38_19]
METSLKLKPSFLSWKNNFKEEEIFRKIVLKDSFFLNYLVLRNSMTENQKRSALPKFSSPSANKIRFPKELTPLVVPPLFRKAGGRNII